MMPKAYKSGRTLAMLLAVTCCFAESSPSGGDLLMVAPGIPLTENDLISGSYNGQSFILGNDLTIHLATGAVLERIGSPSSFFDFHGTLIKLDGGSIANTNSSTSHISNADIRILNGGFTDRDINFGQGVSIFVDGGTIGLGTIFSMNSQLTLEAGTLRSATQFRDTASLVMNGGNTGDVIQFYDSTDFTLNDGSVGDFLRVFNGSMTQNGGSIGFDMLVQGGMLDINGGSIGNEMNWRSSLVTIRATSYTLDGVPGAIQVGESTVIANRDGEVLLAELALGQMLEVTLEDSIIPGVDFIEGNTTVNIVRVDGGDFPLVGDYNLDGIRSPTDIDLLASAIRHGEYVTKYDLNNDGFINISDLIFFITDLVGTHLGDANLDMRVDLVDLSLLAANFGDFPRGWADGDFDASGQVTLSDLSILASNFGITPSVPSPSAAPFYVLMALSLRRRR
ncbi:MAG: hypothetical protein RLN76_06320 [Phycisphaeraceae bacterium]